MKSILQRGWGACVRWHRDAREREEIASLSDAALRDLGIGRAELLSYVRDTDTPRQRRRVAAITEPLGAVSR